MINLLLIGLGPHARRIYLPVAIRDGEKNNFKIVHAIDLEIKRDEIENYLDKTDHKNLEITYLAKTQRNKDKLDNSLVKQLNEIVQKKNISGVIISTEPLAHVCYAEWALNHNLSILMDKPISTSINVSSLL